MVAPVDRAHLVVEVVPFGALRVQGPPQVPAVVNLPGDTYGGRRAPISGTDYLLLAGPGTGPEKSKAGSVRAKILENIKIL